MSAGQPSSPLVVTCGLLWRGGRLLVARRADNGLWELPGGKRAPGEGLAQCLRRELLEELGVEVEVLGPLAVVREPRPGGDLELHCFACRLAEGRPRALEHLELAWVEPAELADLALCPADRELARRLGGLIPPQSDPPA